MASFRFLVLPAFQTFHEMRSSFFDSVVGPRADPYSCATTSPIISSLDFLRYFLVASSIHVTFATFAGTVQKCTFSSPIVSLSL